MASVRATSIAEVLALAGGPRRGACRRPPRRGFLSLRTVATGVAATLQVRPGTSPAFGLDQDLHTGAASGAANALRVEGKDPGAYGNRIEVEVRAPVSGGARRLRPRRPRGRHSSASASPSLRMTPDAERYVERVVNDPRASARCWCG